MKTQARLWTRGAHLSTHDSTSHGETPSKRHRRHHADGPNRQQERKVMTLGFCGRKTTKKYAQETRGARPAQPSSSTHTNRKTEVETRQQSWVNKGLAWMAKVKAAPLYTQNVNSLIRDIYACASDTYLFVTEKAHPGQQTTRTVVYRYVNCSWLAHWGP